MVTSPQPGRASNFKPLWTTVSGKWTSGCRTEVINQVLEREITETVALVGGKPGTNGLIYHDLSLYQSVLPLVIERRHAVNDHIL